MIKNPHLVIIPGTDLQKWIYSVEVKYATNIPRSVAGNKILEHCDLLAAVYYNEAELEEHLRQGYVDDDDVCCGLFAMDDDCFEHYFHLFYKIRDPSENEEKKADSEEK